MNPGTHPRPRPAAVAARASLAALASYALAFLAAAGITALMLAADGPEADANIGAGLVYLGLPFVLAPAAAWPAVRIAGLARPLATVAAALPLHLVLSGAALWVVTGTDGAFAATPAFDAVLFGSGALSLAVSLTAAALLLRRR